MQDLIGFLNHLMINHKLKSINPKNNLIINSWDIPSQKDIETIIDQSFEAQKRWGGHDINFRVNLIKELAYILNHNSKELSILMADEMGKPVKQGKLEIDKCVLLCKYYIESANRLLHSEQIETEYAKSYVSYCPLGLVLGIMPWNFPFWQVFRFAIPSLIVGNGVLLKHASNVQGCANVIKDCIMEAGLPLNIFNILQIPSSLVSNIIENDKISGVALTGSTKAGIEVAKKAGECLKKTVLELGGNDPYLILDDADIDNAVKACIEGRLLNTGQSCISAKRLIVTKKNIATFTDQIVSELSLKVIGDPHDDVDLGPLVSLSARDEVHEMVKISIDKGAKLIRGGEIPNSGGAYYPITILSAVKPGMPAFDEEIFGPVFSIIEAIDNEDAINLANKSKFGLGAAVFTSDIVEGEKIANEKLQAGMCFVNDYVKSDSRMPFGGVKMSGYGRELSTYGLMEFVNIKTIVVENSN